MTYLPDDIAREAVVYTGAITGIQPVSGGCINNGARITSKKGQYFIKWNNAGRYPGMFEAEASGLNLLAASQCIRIPEVVAVLKGSSNNGLLLEYIETGRTTPLAGERMGRQLATLHRQSADFYGLEEDNYMGSLVQKNTPGQDLVEFFITRRLQPQVELAKENGRLDQHIVRQMDALFLRLPELLESEKPALIHGDLWNGNFLVDNHEQPVLIDPAVAYGHREMDLAMTTLFGGFPDSFYTAYQESFPMSAGYRERLELYNLYPLLVHVNLFGGGYLSQTMQIVGRFA